MDREVPVSLYLQLQEGQHADLEVVSRASLELVAALRSLVNFADPSVELTVTIQDGEQGSLRLNAFLRILSERSEEGRSLRAKVLSGFMKGATFFLLEVTASHYYEMVLEALDDKVIEALEADPFVVAIGDEKAEDEDEDKADEADEVERQVQETLKGAIKNDVAGAHIRQFYSEIRKDPNITAVGMATDHDAPPGRLIPRSEFVERSKPPAAPDMPTSRTRSDRQTVLLVQPRLHVDDKAWRFSIAGLEFSAKIADQKFVEQMLSGRESVPLIEGIYLEVDIEYNEERLGDAWTIRSRKITHVHKVIARPKQDSLLGPIEPEAQKGSDDHEDSDED